MRRQIVTGKRTGRREAGNGRRRGTGKGGTGESETATRPSFRAKARRDEGEQLQIVRNVVIPSVSEGSAVRHSWQTMSDGQQIPRGRSG